MRKCLPWTVARQLTPDRRQWFDSCPSGPRVSRRDSAITNPSATAALPVLSSGLLLCDPPPRPCPDTYSKTKHHRFAFMRDRESLFLCEPSLIALCFVCLSLKYISNISDVFQDRQRPALGLFLCATGLLLCVCTIFQQLHQIHSTD